MDSTVRIFRVDATDGWSNGHLKNRLKTTGNKLVNEAVSIVEAAFEREAVTA